MKRIQFVCVRPAHHRARSRPVALCEHLGCDAYCPSGDIGDHEWLPAATDLTSLGCLGYGPREEADEDGDQRVEVPAISAV